MPGSEHLLLDRIVDMGITFGRGVFISNNPSMGFELVTVSFCLTGWEGGNNPCRVAVLKASALCRRCRGLLGGCCGGLGVRSGVLMICNCRSLRLLMDVCDGDVLPLCLGD